MIVIYLSSSLCDCTIFGYVTRNVKTISTDNHANIMLSGQFQKNMFNNL